MNVTIDVPERTLERAIYDSAERFEPGTPLGRIVSAYARTAADKQAHPRRNKETTINLDVDPSAFSGWAGASLEDKTRNAFIAWARCIGEAERTRRKAAGKHDRYADRTKQGKSITFRLPHKHAEAVKFLGAARFIREALTWYLETQPRVDFQRRPFRKGYYAHVTSWYASAEWLATIRQIQADARVQSPTRVVECLIDAFYRSLAQ